MTSYDEIRDRFISKITDFNLLGLDMNTLNDISDSFLISSIPEFRHCKQDLEDRDDTLRSFNFTLSNHEIEILSSLMVIRWLSPQIQHQQKLEQNLGTKDFVQYSPANQLGVMQTIRNEERENIKAMITEYYYFDY